MHLIGVHLTDMYFIGVYGPASQGMHLIVMGMRLVGVRLIGMRLMGMHLVGVHLRHVFVPYPLHSCSLGSLWTARHPIRELSP